MKSSGPLGLFFMLFLLPAVFNVSADEPDQPVEQGVVKWQRDFQAAERIAIRTQRPMFVLFQEIPG